MDIGPTCVRVCVCARARRNDEPATIQKYFAPDAAARGGPAAAQAPLWKDLNLVSVGDL